MAPLEDKGAVVSSSKRHETRMDTNNYMDTEWLDAVPVRGLGHEDLENGRKALLIEKFRRWPLSKYVQPYLKKPHIKLNLDEVGSFVWGLCDGKTRVREIIEEMQRHFGEKIEPADVRLKKFFTMLYKNQFISYIIITEEVKSR